jgi:hypothetical protein
MHFMIFEITAHPNHWTMETVRTFCDSQGFDCKLTEEYPFIIADFGKPVVKKLRILELGNEVSMIVEDDPAFKELEATPENPEDTIQKGVDGLTLSV